MSDSLFEQFINDYFQFLAERIEISKYCSNDQVSILTGLLNKTLSISVGMNPPSISRHLSAVGPRMRYGHSSLNGNNYFGSR